MLVPYINDTTSGCVCRCAHLSAPDNQHAMLLGVHKYIDNINGSTVTMFFEINHVEISLNRLQQISKNAVDITDVRISDFLFKRYVSPQHDSTREQLVLACYLPSSVWDDWETNTSFMTNKLRVSICLPFFANYSFHLLDVFVFFF